MRGKLVSAVGTFAVAVVVLAFAESMGLNWGAPSDAEECASKGDPRHVVEVSAVRVGGVSGYTDRMDVVWFISDSVNGSRSVQSGRFASDGTVACGAQVRITARVHSKKLKVTCLVKVDGKPVAGDRNQVGSCSVKHTVV